MSLNLYLHPLSSYCHKALIAFYENGTPFEPHVVDLGNARSADEFKAIWPIEKFPVLRDEARDQLVPESSIIIEYLDQHYPGRTRFIPQNPELARQTRFRDRFYDLHVHTHMQKIVGDRLRPKDSKDPYGVADARKRMAVAFDIIERGLGNNIWAMGDAFTLADCAAAPALFYANKVAPFEASHPNVGRYLGRLMERPSYARALKEAQPYLHMFPQE